MHYSFSHSCISCIKRWRRANRILMKKLMKPWLWNFTGGADLTYPWCRNTFVRKCHRYFSSFFSLFTYFLIFFFLPSKEANYAEAVIGNNSTILFPYHVNNTYVSTRGDIDITLFQINEMQNDPVPSFFYIFCRSLSWLIISLKFI